MSNIRQNIYLYILSLGLLFVFFIVLTIKFPECSFVINDYKAWMSVLFDNLIPFFSIFLLLYCGFAYKKFEFDLKGTTDPGSKSPATIYNLTRKSDILENRGGLNRQWVSGYCDQ